VSNRRDVRSLAVLETCLYAADLERAEEFYHSVLGLDVVGRMAGRHVFFRCGSGMFLVFNPNRTLERETDFPPHGAYGAGHVAFAASLEEMSAWRTRLEQHGVVIEKDYNWPAGGRSLYFRDPAGNSVELASPNIWQLPARVGP
jgi:catechol 2,3-dioxygenase-like lactoylglutathione lyase family enzyme